MRAACGVVAIGMLLALPASADAAATRFAAPANQGTGDCSTAGNACALPTAVAGSGDGDFVEVLSGNYTVASTLATTKRITIEGAAGQPVPHLTLNDANTGLDYNPGTASTPAALRRLRIDIPNATIYGLQVRNQTTAPQQLLIEDVTVDAAKANVAALRVLGASIVVRDSVVRDRAPAFGAFLFEPIGTSGTNTLELRNLTVDARGASTPGLRVGLAGSGPFPSLSVDALNVIARGTSSDLWAEAEGSGSTATLTTRHSNWRTKQEGPGGSVPADATNQSGDPLFANAAAGDYHLLAGSPAIDAGTPDALLGPVDIDDQPRVMGSAPDIGADETVPGGGAGGGGGGGGLGRDTKAPTGSGLAFSPHTFLPLTRGASIAVTRGSRVSYRLDEAAKVVFTVQQPRSGRRVGKRCVAPTRRNRRRRHCTRYVTLSGSFTHAGKVGKNSFRFSGRLRGKALKPGSYRLSGVPTDAAGNHGRAFSASFTIAKPPRRRR